MSPLTACGTEVKLNGTHVEYKNKLIAGNDASVLEKGAVIVGTADSTSRQTLAAKLKCLFPVELMVSTAFLPNISHVTIPGRVLTRKQADFSSRFKLIYPISLSDGLDERFTNRQWWFEHLNITTARYTKIHSKDKNNFWNRNRTLKASSRIWYR